MVVNNIEKELISWRRKNDLTVVKDETNLSTDKHRAQWNLTLVH